MRRRSSVDRRIYAIAAGVIVVVLSLYLAAPGFLKTVENKLFDLHFTLRGVRHPAAPVAIVAVDENSLGALGRWPWPRSILAQIVRNLTAAGASVIAVDILVSEPEVTGESRAMSRLAERFDALGVTAATPAGKALRAETDELARRDPDRQLAAAIGDTGRTVLPIVFDLRAGIPDAAPEPSGTPLKSALTRFRGYAERGLYPPPHADRATAPIASFAGSAQALGHVTMIPDRDGTTRWEALVFEYNGSYYPSLGVQAVRLFLGLDPSALQLHFGHALAVGPIDVPSDPRNRMLIDWAGPPGTFETVSAMDVVAGKVPATLRGRIVFVGTTAAGTYDLRVTPMSPVFPGVEKHATVAANILDRRFLQRPDWVELVEATGIVVWPLMLSWLLPRFRPVTSLGVTGLLWIAFYGATHAAFVGGLWLPLVYPTLAMGLAFVGITVYRVMTEERQRLWTKRAFQRFVSPEVVERLVNNPEELKFGGEVRNLTVLFSDIRDFTTYTEQHPPEEVVHMLREYLTHMVDQVLAQQGTLDKFIGDAVMAIFGAPVTLADHAERACRAALGMVKEVEALQEKWIAEGREPFRIGIGINTGDMVVGNLGSEQLFDYTVIGDGVNIGARLESLNKEYKTATHIIISETTYQAARDAVEVRHLGEVKVKGKSRPLVVYELVGLKLSTVNVAAPATVAGAAVQS
jgi:adenylate cyclase